jgi:hypothetical protein
LQPAEVAEAVEAVGYLFPGLVVAEEEEGEAGA